MRSGFLVFMGCCSIALGACGGPEGSDDGLEVHRGAVANIVTCAAGPIGSTCADYSDESGFLTIRLKSCPKLASATGIQVVTCLQEPGFAGIGGGGNVVGTPSPGALMTGSLKPTEGLEKWEARFKTQGSSNSYQVQAYSIGLKVVGLTQAQLQSQLVLVTSNSAYSNAPVATATLPAGYVLLGGGGYVDTGPAGGYGMLLKASFPVGNGWRVFGSDHLQADQGFASVMAIGIKKCLSNGVCITSHITSGGNGPYPTGYATDQLYPGFGRVLTGIGALSTDDGVGRFLTHLIPFFQGDITSLNGVTARSKDRSVVSAGSITGYMVSLTAQ